MAKCVTCGRKLGLLSKRYTRSLKGPFCKECEKLQWAVRLIHVHHFPKSHEDPYAAAWVAVCHLVCAERVRIIYQVCHAASASAREYRTWVASRARAIEVAQQALAMLASGSPHRSFLAAVVSRAEKLSSPSAGDVRTVPEFPTHTTAGYHPEDWALISGETTIEDVREVLLSIPGHEWLSTDLRVHASEWLSVD